MSTNEQHSFIRVPVLATSAYWENYAEAVSTEGATVLVRTYRTGSTGASDAQYIIDRLASGLHFAKLEEVN